MTTAAVSIPNHTTVEAIADAMGILFGCPQKRVCVGSATSHKVLGIAILPCPDLHSWKLIFRRAFAAHWPQGELSVVCKELGQNFILEIPADGLWLAMGSQLIEVFGGILYYNAADPTAGSEICALSFDAENFGCFEPWAYFEIAIKQLEPITDCDIEKISMLAEAGSGKRDASGLS